MAKEKHIAVSEEVHAYLKEEADKRFMKLNAYMKMLVEKMKEEKK